MSSKAIAALLPTRRRCGQQRMFRCRLHWSASAALDRCDREMKSLQLVRDLRPDLASQIHGQTKLRRFR